MLPVPTLLRTGTKEVAGAAVLLLVGPAVKVESETPRYFFLTNQSILITLMKKVEVNEIFIEKTDFKVYVFIEVNRGYRFSKILPKAPVVRM